MKHTYTLMNKQVIHTDLKSFLWVFGGGNDVIIAEFSPLVTKNPHAKVPVV